MASIKISQLPAKGANLASTDLVEISEFTGTGYVSKSITGQEIIDGLPVPSVAWGDISGTITDQTDLTTELNGKQDTLVSGTNIKTINGNSLLGSGNIAINSTPSFGTHFNYPIINNNIYNNALQGNAVSNGNGIVANQIFGLVFSVSKNLKSVDISVNVSATGSGRLCKIVVYSSTDLLNWTLEGNSTDINCDTSGVKTWSGANINFVPNKFYVVAAIGNVTISASTLVNANVISMGTVFNTLGQTQGSAISYNVGSYSVPSSFTTNYTIISNSLMAWFKLQNA